MKLSASQISSGKELESGGSRLNIFGWLQKSTCLVDGTMSGKELDMDTNEGNIKVELQPSLNDILTIGRVGINPTESSMVTLCSVRVLFNHPEQSFALERTLHSNTFSILIFVWKHLQHSYVTV